MKGIGLNTSTFLLSVNGEYTPSFIEFEGASKSELDINVSWFLRISQQLGLDALAGVVKAPSIKICDDPDKIFACTKEIDTEERIRTYWMAEMMESILILEMKGRYSSEPVPNSAQVAR